MWKYVETEDSVTNTYNNVDANERQANCLTERTAIVKC